jgi:hypothetical protein
MKSSAKMLVSIGQAIICAMLIIMSLVVFIPGTLVAADDTAPTFHTIDPSMWQLTEEEAIAIASSYIPPAVLEKADVHAGREMWGNNRTGESHSGWAVAFMDISVMQEELGWQADDYTYLEGLQPYNCINVLLDSTTGELISRRAYFAVTLGMPVAADKSFSQWWWIAGGGMAVVACSALFFIFRLRKRRLLDAGDLHQ